jgi:hypothetical protein
MAVASDGRFPHATILTVVIAGLDPAIHHTKMMDARVPQASVRSLRKLGCFARA